MEQIITAVCRACGVTVHLVSGAVYEVYRHDHFHLPCARCGARKLAGVIYYANHPSNDTFWCTDCAAEHECDVHRAGLDRANHLGTGGM